MVAFLAGARAFAQTFSIAAGASVSTINSTIATAAATSGNITVNFAAGVYNINGVVTIPCPAGTLTLQGPPAAYRAPASMLPGGYSYSSPYTANLNGSLGSGWGWTVGSNGCTHAITIQYFNWNGGQPSGGGGGWIDVVAGESDLTIQNNYIHGVWANTATSHDYDDLIALEGVGFAQLPINTNIKILWNVFGDGVSDSNRIMNLVNYQGGVYNSSGGYCGAVGVHASTTNMVIQYNDFEHLEQPVSLFQGLDNAGDWPHTFMLNNLLFDSNDIGQWHRIGLEGQQSVNWGNHGRVYRLGGVANFTNLHDVIDPQYGMFGFSIPMCCKTTLATRPRIISSTGNNTMVDNVLSPSFTGYAFEWCAHWDVEAT